MSNWPKVYSFETVSLLFSKRFFEDLYDILVTKDLIEADFLGIELDTATPDDRMTEVLQKIFMDLQDGSLHSQSVSTLGEN